MSSRDPTTRDLTVKQTGDLKLTGGTGTATFNVKNESGLEFDVRVAPELVTPTGPGKFKSADAQWLRVAGDDKLKIPNGESRPFSIVVDTTRRPVIRVSESYVFAMLAVSHDNPDAHWGLSDPVVFTIDPPPPPPKVWPYIVAGSVVLATIIGVVLWLVLRGVLIPDVSTQTVKDATKTLSDKGFVVDANLVQKPSTRPTNLNVVVSTDPLADTRLRKGKSIKLIVNVIEMVDEKPVINMDALAAANTLSAQGFNVVLGDRQPSSKAQDTVLDQTPEPGKQEYGQTIKLTLAAPLQLPPVPDLRGLKLADALKKLRDDGFAVAFPKSQVTILSPAGEVVSIEPLQGTGITVNQPVTLFYAVAPAAPLVTGTPPPKHFESGPMIDPKRPWLRMMQP